MKISNRRRVLHLESAEMRSCLIGRICVPIENVTPSLGLSSCEVFAANAIRLKLDLMYLFMLCTLAEIRRLLLNESILCSETWTWC